MARVYDSPPPADDNGGGKFGQAVKIARRQRNLFRRADGLRVALCQLADDETAAASLTAEQNAADIETVGKLATALKRRHISAARSAVFAAASALQEAEYSAAVSRESSADDYATAGILCELRGIL